VLAVTRLPREQVLGRAVFQVGTQRQECLYWLPDSMRVISDKFSVEG
jgi:hypothetical protein